ncbi:MAG: Synechococcus phage [Actinomycetota bacterium]
MAVAHEYDDLQQILGYQGAIDEREGLTQLGHELYTVPFWTPSFCSTIIRAAEAVGAFELQPDDPVPGHEVSLAVISPRLFEQVEIDLGRRIWPQLQEVWPFIDYHGLRDVFVIKYELGQQEHLRMHHDVAQVSASAKLNEGYEGAVLDFPRQGVDNRSVPVGELVVWPSLVTHPHQATPLQSGVKYGLTVWFELPTF